MKSRRCITSSLRAPDDGTLTRPTGASARGRDDPTSWTRDRDSVLELGAQANGFAPRAVRHAVEPVLVHREPLRPFVEPHVVAVEVQAPLVARVVEVQAPLPARGRVQGDEE